MGTHIALLYEPYHTVTVQSPNVEDSVFKKLKVGPWMGVKEEKEDEIAVFFATIMVMQRNVPVWRIGMLLRGPFFLQVRSPLDSDGVTCTSTIQMEVLSLGRRRLTW